MSRSTQSQTSSLKIYFRLLAYVKPYIGLFLISIFGFLIFASTQPMLGYVLKFFVDGLNNPDASFFASVPYLNELSWLEGLKLLQAVPLLIVLIALLQGIGSFLGNYFLAKVSLGLVHDMRVALFNNLLVLPNRYFDSHNSGHLISRITYNVTMVTGAATDAIKVVVREGMTVVFLFVTLLLMNWKLTLVMLAILPVIGLMVSSASKKFRKQSKKIQVAMGDVTHVASETIQGYRVVRSFGGEAYEQGRFYQASSDNSQKQLRMVKTNAVYTPSLQLVIYGAMAVLMFLVLLLRGDASPGELVAYITLAGLLPKPIRQLSEVSSTIQKGVAGAESIFEQLDEKLETDNGTQERAKVTGRLDVRNLSFRYEGSDKTVLADISFVAEPGQMVALVGRSGSGKSTLANLIPRFYHHDQGQILLDDLDVEDYKLRNLRKHIALVTQHVTLFNDTVRNNIAYGDLANAPIENVKRASESAYAAEFIEQMPQGYDTVVGENGVLLSGGQRQRLAIARALLKDAPLLILDEATSALDTESERHIQAALDEVMKGRTTLVIAHRLSTIEKADLILVMDKGRIVERGTHTELLALNGYYARLHERDFVEPAEPSIQESDTLMLNHLRVWRERGWTSIDAAAYAEAWQHFGGSVATHPQVLERLSGLAGIAVRYLGWFSGGELQAAIPTWGRHLALSKDVLKQQGKRGLFDLGNAELILPAAPSADVSLRHRGRYISMLNVGAISTLREQPEGLALAREPEEYSKKFRYNQRREQRLLEEAGGVIRPMLELSAAEQALIYADLFQRRWGFEATGKAHLTEVFSLMRDFMAGSLIYLNDQPVAIQVLYRVEAPQWISLEYINGGVDPQNREFSPGSVLSFINTQSAWSEARALGKPLRYSFGRADREYKDRWCNRVAVYQV